MYEYVTIKAILYPVFILLIIVFLTGTCSDDLTRVDVSSFPRLPFLLPFLQMQELIDIIAGINRDTYGYAMTITTIVFYSALLRFLFLTSRKGSKFDFAYGYIVLKSKGTK